METTDVQNKFIFRYHSVLIIDVLPKYFICNYHELSF